MSSVSGIRLPGLATGMDTEAMVKEMLTGDQNKVDKIKQKEQIIKWQQETYREIIKDIQGLNDKYFSLSSKNSIVNASAWNTLTVNSSNSNVITATGSAGANKVDYKFELKKLAGPAKGEASTAVNNKQIKKDSSLEELGLSGETTFTIKYGDGEKEVSKPITIRTEPKYKVDENGQPVYEKDKDGNNKLDENGQPIKVIEEPADTIETLIKKINNSTSGEVKASYSEMSGKFTIESAKTGTDSNFQIVAEDGKTSSSALDFLGLKGTQSLNGKFSGENSEIIVSSKDGKEIKTLNEQSNSFTIDGIKYNVHSVGSSEITSKQDVQPVIDNMKAFVEDYNKMMDKMYDLVTEKVDKDYAPLTEEQKKEMSEEEIERWEKKAKEGVLRNDSEMRRFIDDMQRSIFGDNMHVLNEMGLTSHEDYNKKGQIALDEDKFRKALESNSDKVYQTFAKDSSSVMERMKDNIKKYVGSSSSIFARKAGIEKTASVVNNFYSEQLRKQSEILKTLQRKMDDKEDSLYKKFSALESSMNKLNSQMNYFMQM